MLYNILVRDENRTMRRAYSGPSREEAARVLWGGEFRNANWAPTQTKHARLCSWCDKLARHQAITSPDHWDFACDMHSNLLGAHATTECVQTCLSCGDLRIDLDEDRICPECT